MDERLDFAACFALKNMLAAADECYRGVRWKGQPQRFMSQKLTNCKILLDEVMDGTYEPRKVTPFVINERGKVREVKPVAYRDRVVQRCFCDRILIPSLSKYVSDECSAVFPGRGLSYAYDRVRGHASRCDSTCWYVQFDYSNYFASIDKRLVIAMLGKLIDDERLISFARAVLKDERGGLELGSHVSQLCAAAYASPVDFAVEGMSGVVGYHRYMDDGIVFCDSKESALAALESVNAMSRRLHLELNGKKTIVNRVTHPFVFCKMRFEWSDGGVRMCVRKAQTRRAAKHAKSVQRLSKRKPSVDVDPVIASFRGYVQRGDADLEWLVERTFRPDK